MPAAALQLLPGDGPAVGAPLTAAPGIAGVCFTGSTEVAQAIHRALAENAAPDAVLIAETGGLNAMIVNSTALTEQVVRDVLASAFQSAGQRCSALRILYVQEEARERVLEMLGGAMEALKLGDPWDPATDVGPVIDAEAEEGIRRLRRGRGRARRGAEDAAGAGRGRFVAPTVIAVDGIGAVEREVFGPVLHVAGFRAAELDRVVDAINARGFGLTFGLHSRIDDRVERVTARLHVGNAYVNRNQIGAIVGSQPFGGEGLAGPGRRRAGRSICRGCSAGRRSRRRRRRRGPRSRPRRWPRRWRRSTPATGRGGRTGWRRCAPRSGTPAGGGGARRGGGAAAGAARPAGADRREQPAEPAPARAGALPRARGRGGAGAGGAGAGRGQRRARGGGGAPWALAALEGLPVARDRRAGRAGEPGGLAGLALVAAAGPADWLRALRRALSRRGGPIVPLGPA